MLKTLKKKFLKAVGKTGLNLVGWASGHLFAMDRPSISVPSFADRLEDKRRKSCGRCPACMARKTQEQNEFLN